MSQYQDELPDFQIIFRVHCETQFKQYPKIVGNISELGDWDPYKGLAMQTNDDIYPYWFCDKISVQQLQKIQFKIVIFYEDQLIEWEQLQNANNREFIARQYQTRIEFSKNNIFMKEQIVKRLNNQHYQSFSIQNVKRVNLFKAIDPYQLVRDTDTESSEYSSEINLNDYEDDNTKQYHENESISENLSEDASSPKLFIHIDSYNNSGYVSN